LDVEATANASKKDSSVMTLEVTRVAVAQSLKCSAESNLSNSEGVELSNQRKDSEHSKAVQAKRRAQKQSCSIVKSNDESVEDSKPAAVTTFDVAVNFHDDKHEDVQDASKISTMMDSHSPDQATNDFSPLPWCIDRVGDTCMSTQQFLFLHRERNCLKMLYYLKQKYPLIKCWDW